jgi:hypothetical protein
LSASGGVCLSAGDAGLRRRWLFEWQRSDRKAARPERI